MSLNAASVAREVPRRRDGTGRYLNLGHRRVGGIIFLGRVWLIRLAFLTPDLVGSIVEGRHAGRIQLRSPDQVGMKYWAVSDAAPSELERFAQLVRESSSATSRLRD